MRKRYTIEVQQHGSDHHVELMDVGSNPEAIAAGLRLKQITMRRKITEPGTRVYKMPLYTSVRIIDRGE